MSDVRVIVVDDHDLVVYALTRLLSAEDGIDVVASTGNGEQAVEMVGRHDVDVIVLDRRLEGGVDAIDLIPRLHDAAPHVKVLVLSGTSDDNAVARAVAAGCHGFLAKDEPSSQIVRAVRGVAAGEHVFAPSMLAGVLRSRVVDPSQGLSPREVEVLQLLARGRSTNEIAAALYVSVNTVRNHVNNVMRKLDVHSRLEAVSAGVKLGLIEIG
ncbi:MAG: response regulator transcription factor [Ilumatobacteraceae bacterium]